MKKNSVEDRALTFDNGLLVSDEKNLITVKVKVDTTEIDNAIEKIRQLKSIMNEITAPAETEAVRCNLMVGDMVVGQVSVKRADTSFKNFE